MNILLVGGACQFMSAMIQKFSKCGHRVHVLAGRRNREDTYPRADEVYYFSYGDECIMDVMRSVEPDAVLFLGPYDTNFKWEDARQNTVGYISGLVNLLTAFSLNHKGRFFYLSSHEVYGQSYLQPIDEDVPTSADTQKALIIAQGERLCSDYHIGGVNTHVIRLDHLYGMTEPHSGGYQDICFEKCLSALKKGVIEANGQLSYSMIYLNDAVEILYQIITAEELRHTAYHISSMETVTDMQLAQFIQKAIEPTPQILDNTLGEPHTLVLSSRRCREEFDIRFFTNIADGAARTAQYMDKHRKDYTIPQEADMSAMSRLQQWFWRLWRIFIPFAENILLFIPVFFLSQMTEASPYFTLLDPFLLYVIVFALVHGQQQAVFASILSGIGYFWIQLKSSSGMDILLNGSMYVWFAQLFVVGIAVGYMRDRMREMKTEAKEESRYLQGQVSDLMEINDSNMRMKLAYETELINQKQSLGKIYEITSELNRYELDEVLFAAVKVVSLLLDSRDVAIYRIANEDYARLVSATSETARQLGNSIRFRDMFQLYAEVSERHVFINRTLEEHTPLMASGLFNGEELRLLIFVWDMSYENMTLSQANRLAVVSALIQNAAIRASTFMHALEADRLVPGTNVLNEESFSALVKVYANGRREGLIRFVILNVDPGQRSIEQVGEELHKILRQSDYVGRSKGGHIYILLPNAESGNANIVINRLREHNYVSRISEAVI